jgi:hypothetical protein
VKKEDLLKEVKVVALQKLYRNGRMVQSGESCTVSRFEFSRSLMVAVDAEGNPTKDQPKELNDKEVRAVLYGEEVASQSYSAPVLTKEDMDRSNEEVIEEVIEEEEEVIEEEEVAEEGLASLV